MSDNFLREIDEEVRRDKVAELWKKHGNLIILALVLVVLGVGAWRFWQNQQEQAAQVVSARLEEALKASRESRSDDAEKLLGEVAGGSNQGYRLVARFRLAAETARQDADSGAKAFDALAGDAAIETVFRDLARLRAAFLRVDTASYAEIRAVVEPLAVATGIWRHSAREALGLAALKGGNLEEAGRWFDQIVIDRDAPQGLRQRADLYLALVRGGPVEVK
jgi:hypothetical protein